MSVLDVFNSDFFGVVSLTQSLDLKPYKPNWLGGLGLFKNSGITTKMAVIEERHGRLSLVPTSARGTNVTTEKRMGRKAIPFLVPHIALSDGLQSDDIQNVRAFGQENTVETIAGKSLELISQLRDDIEITKEYHRYGAIQGIVLDADMATVIYNFFTAFGVAEPTESFDLTAVTDTGSIKQSCTDVIRLVHLSLGAKMHSGIIGLAGDEFFDALTSNVEVKSAYNRWQDNRFARASQIAGAQGFTVGADNMPGFEFGGITFLNSRAKIGTDPFIPTAQCRFFPTGVPDLFLEINAPADYIESVNTPGMPFYAKQERMKWDKGVEFEVQSNPLIIPTLPGTLVKGTIAP
jgi:hypothetical protein